MFNKIIYPKRRCHSKPMFDSYDEFINNGMNNN